MIVVQSLLVLPFLMTSPQSARQTSFVVAAEEDACEETAALLLEARKNEVLSEYGIALAYCANLTDPEDREDCEEEAEEELESSMEEAEEQFAARIELCEQLGGGPYDPIIDPANFLTDITHPYLPLVRRTVWKYQKETQDGLEVETMTVLDQVKEILGVPCTIVRHKETLDGVVQEDTFDYFAQDVWGNVWYFGELSMGFENGELDSLGGSWIAGVDGAKPGIVMLAEPTVGITYRLEFLLGDAEDAATVLALDAVVDVPYGHFANCLETLDFTPLESGSEEHKFYAPGIGLVLELDLESGEALELIDVDFGNSE